MKSKSMKLAFLGVLALSAIAPNAVAAGRAKVGGNAHSQGPTAVGQSKRLPPQRVQDVAGTAHGPNAVIGKKPNAVPSNTK